MTPVCHRRPIAPPAVLVLAVLLAAAACAPKRPSLASRAAGRPAVLAVVAWNMNVGRGDLPRLVDDVASGRLTGVPVRHYIFLLQESIEGGRHDVVRFATARGLSTFYTPQWMTGEGLLGTALLSSTPLLNARPIELPRERRVRTAAAATLQFEGERLFAVSTHLENRTSWLQGALFSDSARGRQVDALLRSLPKGPGIVGGDLNTWLGRDEPAWRTLLARFDDTPPERLGPTFRERLELDHLFFDLPARWEAATQVLPDRYGSDHHPVLGLVLERERS